MASIYTPAGRAREYSPLAVNLYNSCDHLCHYCYAARMSKAFGRPWGDNPTPTPAMTPAQLATTFRKHAGSREQVLFCFTTDPYSHADVEHGLTRVALTEALANRVPVSILTKGGRRALRDLDLFQRFGRSILVGATLTGCDDLEPGAAPNAERLEVLRELHAAGVPTWASFEPVIRPDASLALLREAVQVCDLVKIGKVNDWQGADKGIDWRAFLDASVAICEAARCRYYIKTDLWQQAGRPPIDQVHRLPDLYGAEPFPTTPTVTKGQASLL